MSEYASVRSRASAHRGAIFKHLLGLPHDPAYLGYLVTRKAKELGLVNEDRKNIKGNTLLEWSVSTETDGYNTPNAWASKAAVHLLLDYRPALSLSSAEICAFAYYLSQPGDEDAYNQAAATVTTTLGTGG
jgi:hypothetical protein